jgi:hypothetical protein
LKISLLKQSFFSASYRETERKTDKSTKKPYRKQQKKAYLGDAI